MAAPSPPSRLLRNLVAVLLPLFSLAAPLLALMGASAAAVWVPAVVALPVALVLAWPGRRAAPRDTGHENRAAVLFLDIRDFTLLTAQMEPRTVFALVNRLFGEVTPLIRTLGGHVDKFTGDGVMAVFGLQGNLPNPALAAIRCALKIQEACAWLNCTDAYRRTLGILDPIRVEVGIGVAKGRVLTGCLDGDGHAEVTSLGRTVNLAARLCERAGRGQVLCCNFSFLDVREVAMFHRSHEVQMKGLDKPIKTYSIEGLNLPEALARKDRAVTTRLQHVDEVDEVDMATRVIRRMPERLRPSTALLPNAPGTPAGGPPSRE